MARKCPYRVNPAETGGLTTYQAQKVLEEMLEELRQKVDVGPWRSTIDTHKKLGTITVKLELNLWKKGWSPPPEAIQECVEDTERKRRLRQQKEETPTKKPAPKTSPSRKSSKKAR